MKRLLYCTLALAAAFVAAVAIAAALSPKTASAQLQSTGNTEGGHEPLETKGLIEIFPANLTGTWQVGGITYTAVLTTYFQQSERPFAVGTCVVVRYEEATHILRGVKSQRPSVCGVEEVEAHEAKGIVRALPDETLTGTWQIDEAAYRVFTGTVIDQSHGPVYVGVCVEVRYVLMGDQRTALKIETAAAEVCGIRPVVTPTLEYRGFISSAPLTGTLFGTWQIGEKTFEAITGTTQFSQERGPLAVDTCARVRYYAQNEQRVALWITSDFQHECSRPEDFHIMFGEVISHPNTASRVGFWNIGGQIFAVIPATEFHGPVEDGALAKVTYRRQEAGILVAFKIEAKERGDEEAPIGKAVGILQSRPETPTIAGTWVVASVTYTATAETRTAGPLVAGDCVEMMYRAAEGNRFAFAIKTTSPVACDSGDIPANKTFGFVQQMPPDGFVGTWLIGGVSFETNADTTYDQHRGELALGAFVEVRYRIVDGIHVVAAMEVHVPPRAGDIDVVGRCDVGHSVMGNDAAANAITVGGQTYVILGATVLDEASGALTSGATVSVNAYTDVNTGQRIATQVTILGAHQTSLPVVMR